jgi:hypothetical protein
VSDLRPDEILARLGDGWTVLHSERADVDHVVIGPSGVFTVRVEHCPGKGVWARGAMLSTNGRATPYVREACETARAIRRRLETMTGMTLPVTAVIAFIDPASVNAQQPIGDATTEVRVVRDLELRRALEGDEVLTSEDVERIAGVARRLQASSTPREHVASRGRRPHALAGALASLVRRDLR